MANTSPSLSDSPINQDSAKKPAPTPIAMAAIERTTRCNSLVSGVVGAGVAVVIDAIAARRVPEPVAVTATSASPSTTNVPAYTASSTIAGADSLSPVNSEVSTSTVSVSTTRPSAGMRSPASSRTTSPTTISMASTATERPSRRTFTSDGSSTRNRSAARSARRSWTNANTALNTTTAEIATASDLIPAIQAIAAAAHSIRAKKWTRPSANCSTTGRVRAVGRTLGPSAARRAVASAAVRPGRSTGGRPPDRAPSALFAGIISKRLRQRIVRRGGSAATVPEVRRSRPARGPAR